MAYRKAEHHKGTHHRRSALIRQAAAANPSTQCWRCRKTMSEIRKTKPRARWTAGHLVDGLKDGPLAPECSPCNFAAGARLGNQRRRRGTLAW